MSTEYGAGFEKRLIIDFINMRHNSKKVHSIRCILFHAKTKGKIHSFGALISSEALNLILNKAPKVCR